MSCFVFHRLSRIVIAFLGVMALSACNLFDLAADRYRYRLTVEVDTPEGIKTGSTVIEVRTLPASTTRTRVKGEAVAVDMPDGKVLFALLRSENDIDWAGRIMLMMAPRFTGENSTEKRLEAIARDRSEREVPRDFPRQAHLPKRSAYPMLVTFDDLDDPTSVAQVDRDDLAETFGEGVSIRRITVQVTDDPVTTGIENRLGWLSKYPEPRLDPDYRGSSNPNLSQSLWHGDFRKGTAE